MDLVSQTPRPRGRGRPVFAEGKEWTHKGDPVEIVGPLTETGFGGFSGTGKGPLLFGERGAYATQNGNHDLGHVWFSQKIAFISSETLQDAE